MRNLLVHSQSWRQGLSNKIAHLGFPGRYSVEHADFTGTEDFDAEQLTSRRVVCKGVAFSELLHLRRAPLPHLEIGGQNCAGLLFHLDGKFEMQLFHRCGLSTILLVTLITVTM